MQPDQKLRSERLEVQGGGNCGNALTAASRLGTEPFIITMVGAHPCIHPFAFLPPL